MATKYASDSADALADIKEAGGVVTFTRGGSAVYDAATDTWSGGSSAPVSGYAIQRRGDVDRFAALSLVLVDPVTLLVAAWNLTITPQPGDAMLWAGVTYTVRDVDAVAPDGTAILYSVTGSK